MSSLLPSLAESQGDPDGGRYDRIQDINESIEILENELGCYPLSKNYNYDRELVELEIAGLKADLLEIERGRS